MAETKTGTMETNNSDDPIFTMKKPPSIIITESIAMERSVDEMAFFITFASFMRERISPVFLFAKKSIGSFNKCR